MKSGKHEHASNRETISAQSGSLADAEWMRIAAKLVAESWAIPSNVKLSAGEMTAQELRTAQAVARGISAAIDAIRLPEQATNSPETPEGEQVDPSPSLNSSASARNTIPEQSEFTSTPLGDQSRIDMSNNAGLRGAMALAIESHQSMLRGLKFASGGGKVNFGSPLALDLNAVETKLKVHSARLEIARSIGATAGETNHMVRADEVVRVVLSLINGSPRNG